MIEYSNRFSLFDIFVRFTNRTCKVFIGWIQMHIPCHQIHQKWTDRNKKPAEVSHFIHFHKFWFSWKFHEKTFVFEEKKCFFSVLYMHLYEIHVNWIKTNRMWLCFFTPNFYSTHIRKRYDNIINIEIEGTIMDGGPIAWGHRIGGEAENAFHSGIHEI